MKNVLTDFFYFNQQERRGIYVLICLIIGMSLLNFILPLLSSNPIVDHEKFNRLLAHYDSVMNPVQDTTHIQLHPFDPNKITLNDWLNLGLTTQQASVIINYRNKGGKFFRKEDLKKIYSISEDLYQKLEPYIVITTQQSSIHSSKKHQTSFKKILIELNTADSLQLLKVRGIGPVFSSRILKYRNLLGGFTSKEQLIEVYGIDSVKYQSIKDQFTESNLGAFRQLNINIDEFRKLLKHPYISYDFTKYIINTRSKGDYKRVTDIYNEVLISDSLFTKLLPYLKTE
ncbi:MAG: hypothetical protein GY834_14025 [Bacteroidetes bacterium]|nr:hypothetical protein [Bacteroidota bacterium]